MRTYWRYHRLVDSLLPLIVATALWHPKFFRLPEVFVISSSLVVSISINLFSVSAGVLGLGAATIAFITSISSDRDFVFLGKSRSYKQLWQTLSFFLYINLISTVISLLVCLLDDNVIMSIYVRIALTAILVAWILQLAKFIWLMCAIISVKEERGGRSNE